MTSVDSETALGVLRLGGYVGFVLLAGTIAFSALIWPDGFRDRTLGRFGAGGAVLATLTTIGSPLVHLLANTGFAVAVGGRVGIVGGLIRVAALVVTLTFLPDLTAQRPVGVGRRIWAGIAVTTIAATYVVRSDAMTSAWPVLALAATAAHLLATAAWLGGLVALATVVIPRSHRDVLHQILPRFSLLAITCVLTLTATGILHAVLAARGIHPLLTSTYGLVLLLKVGLFGFMLLLGNQGRAYATRLARRQLEDFDASTTPAGLRVLAVAIGAELALALGVLAMTAVLVAVAPVPG